MKLGIVSDIHTELGVPQVDLRLPERVDVMILAGDIGKGVQAIQFAHDTYGEDADHIVCVAGNHEFWGGTHASVLQKMRDWAADIPNLHFLENNRVDIDGVQFIGSTAWTDYSYGGASQPLNMYRAHDLINDYKKIKWLQHGKYRKLLSRDCLEMNHRAKSYIFGELGRSKFDKNVVITHHAPTGMSVPEMFEADESNFCYANTWGNDIAYSSADLWVHGHMHEPSDYMVGDCRVLANPMDYPEKARPRAPLIIEI